MTGAVHHDAGRGTAYDLGLTPKHARVAARWEGLGEEARHHQFTPRPLPPLTC